MIAFDTNLLVRAATNDDPAQVAVVRQLLALNAVFISRTVLLETEWVLRAGYRKTREQISRFFAELLETDNTVIENHEAVAQALDWYRLGADFADALHLAACGRAILHTFDQGFCKAAREQGLTPEVQVLRT
ncbi:MAG: type II toxin-antitoxin system VapC family toxin [Candidatus Contendobacter sp.]|nr:MAG: type II toxin-antitoxin system VapC family toxin [Candidatus Contendobacter sp.]